MMHDDLVKAISSLTLKDINQLVKSLKENFGISDMALSPAAGPSNTPAAAAPAAEEQTEFAVFLTGVSEGTGKKIGVIKKIREIVGTSLSLGDAKKIVDEVASSPYEVKSGISKQDANKLKEDIEGAGGIVEVK